MKTFVPLITLGMLVSMVSGCVAKQEESDGGMTEQALSTSEGQLATPSDLGLSPGGTDLGSPESTTPPLTDLLESGVADLTEITPPSLADLEGMDAPEFDFTLNFGEMDAEGFGPFSSSFFDEFDFGFDEDTPLPPFGPVSLEEFTQAWQVSVSITDEPAGSVLARLTDELGLTLDSPEEFSAELARPVTLNLENVSRLQVIEELCQQIGVHPKYRLERIALRSGPRRWPVTFAGPFLVEIQDLEEVAPYGIGSLELQLTGGTMSVDANSWIQNVAAGLLTCEAVEGTGGVDLREESHQFWTNPTTTATIVRSRSQENLKHMVRSVTEIERLAGVVRFDLPTEMIIHRFDSLTAGESITEGGWSITLDHVELGESSSIGLSVRGSDSQSAAIFVFNEQGEMLKPSGRFSTSFGDMAQLHVFYDGKPVTSEVRLTTQLETVEYPFELTGIPLSRSHEMPESIEPLEFNSETPVEVEFLRTEDGDFSRMFVFRVTNHTNKDLSLLVLKLNYLDEQGESLGDFPQSQTGSPIVAAGDTSEMEIMGFFAPDETASVSAELVEIRAMDASRWSAGE